MFNSIVKNLLAVVTSCFMIIGCSQDKVSVDTTYISPKLKNAPKWVTLPQVDGFIAEIGSASQNAGDDFNFQREEAMSNARENLAKQIEIKVNTMFKSFNASTGSGKNTIFDKSIEQVSKQIASKTLFGSRVKDTWISKNGTLFVLMVIDTKVIEDYMEYAIKTSFNNDRGLHRRFLASKAQKELKKELENVTKDH